MVNNKNVRFVEPIVMVYVIKNVCILFKNNSVENQQKRLETF